MAERLRRFLGRGGTPAPGPVLQGLLPGESEVVAFCHPRWRGVRTATYTWGVPVVEVDDLSSPTGIVDRLLAAGTQVVVVSGFPEGSGRFIESAASAGLATRCVLHSSLAQHGAEAGEAAVADAAVRLGDDGVLGRLGFVKRGVAEAMSALGHHSWYVPNRSPRLPAFAAVDLGPGLHIGVFAEPFWRKNVVTQLAAVAMIPGAVAHVMRRPDVGYLDGLRVVEHGELPYDEFIGLQASVDLNLYVTLSECHPLTPVESYLSGVPCLLSRTSAVFSEDEGLWNLTTVSEADDPVSIAAGARRLMDARHEAIDRAMRWIPEADARAAALWAEFVSG